MKTVENLENNECLLVSARKVNGGKVQLTFAQKIQNPNARPASIAGILNASDDRFKQVGKPRYAWQAAEASDAGEYFGLDFSGLKNVGDSMDINKLVPLNIQITETTEGNEWEVANFENSAKRAGKDGDYILTPEGKYIYTRTSVVETAPKHVFISDTVRSSEMSGAVASDAIEEAIDLG